MAVSIVETKSEKMRRKQKSTKRCVASVSQEWGPGCCLGS